LIDRDVGDRHFGFQFRDEENSASFSASTCNTHKMGFLSALHPSVTTSTRRANARFFVLCCSNDSTCPSLTCRIGLISSNSASNFFAPRCDRPWRDTRVYPQRSRVSRADHMIEFGDNLICRIACLRHIVCNQDHRTEITGKRSAYPPRGHRARGIPARRFLPNGRSAGFARRRDDNHALTFSLCLVKYRKI